MEVIRGGESKHLILMSFHFILGRSQLLCFAVVYSQKYPLLLFSVNRLLSLLS